MLENKDYYVKNQKVKVKVFDLELEFIEKVAIDKNTEEEIYVREIEIENDIRLYDIYKKEKGLLQSSEIKKIREKYGLNQKEFSRILGLGDITIHRYENGTIQTIANDSLIRFVQNPENMEQVALINQKKINEKVFTKLMKKIKTLKLYARHRIADFNINKLHQLEFNTEYVIDIAERVITVYNEEIAQKIDKYNITLPKITNLELQKFLYYIQALSLITFDKPAYKENILAWDYGPVVYEVYCKYRNYKNNEI
ncbi:MAG TPA: type II TA system antitoxin MqsA family protein, partial [Haloplasmataceae bacterium]